MRLYLFGTVLFCVAVFCQANPIIINAPDAQEDAKNLDKPQSSEIAKVKQQEESEIGQSSSTDNTETSEDAAPTTTEVNAIESTSLASVKKGRTHHHALNKAKETGRQSSDDDDDDDDDDILDDDDDDDDDTAADDADDDDDDDGGDYFDGLFDDILGGGDDDDDDDDDDDEDDEEESAPPAPSVVTNTAQLAQIPSPSQSSAENAIAQEEAPVPNSVVPEESDAENETGALKGQPKMPQIYITKYNKFVDAVLNRINRMLGKQYDPVRVKLLSQTQRENMKNKILKSNEPQITNKMGELQLARSEMTEPEFVLISKVGSTTTQEQLSTPTIIKTTHSRQNNRKKQPSNTKNKKPTRQTSTKPVKTKQSANNKNKQKAKATLFGLSTLKRDGDVTVMVMPDFTTVKSNFVLGPLTLRVEREIGTSGKRELRSATATTAEMFGRLNLKLVHGGVATLNSLRVLQPKQVRIDSQDDHDKTTEFMWKRSPQIASIVSQKLGAVARDMLKNEQNSKS